AFIAIALVATCQEPARRTVETGQKPLSGFTVLRTVPYVRHLALLILLSTIGAGLLDYVFKVRVSAAHPDSDELVRFFALFYAATGIATFLVQLMLSRVAIDKLGIAGTVSGLPVTLAVGSIGGLVLPGLSIAFAARAGEAVFRSSLFKSGYEMLYAAVPRGERRATKAILDIGVERSGDLFGAILIGAVTFVISRNASDVILVFAAFMGLTGF